MATQQAPVCPGCQGPTTWKAGGTNKAGKPYNPSWQCVNKCGAPPAWINPPKAGGYTPQAPEMRAPTLPPASSPAGYVPAAAPAFSPPTSVPAPPPVSVGVNLAVVALECAARFHATDASTGAGFALLTASKFLAWLRNPEGLPAANQGHSNPDDIDPATGQKFGF